MTLIIEQGYVCGGSADHRVAPNFRLKEFKRADGSVYFHRDLIAAVQELRDVHRAPVSIKSFDPANGLGKGLNGRFLWITAANMDALEKDAGVLVKTQFVTKVARKGEMLYLEIADPLNPPPLLPANAMERAIRVTSAFETSGDPFLQVTGNFDGAGLSFGPLQVNFGTGTLQTLFERFRIADADLLRKCFTDEQDWSTWSQVMRSSRLKQIEWANTISIGARKADVAQPWKGYLQNVGRVEKFRSATLAYAYDSYGRKLIRALSWLQGLTPIPIDDFACLSALYDLCVQQGSLDKAHNEIRARVATEHPADQIHLVHMAVEERGKKASKAFRADCVSRRLGILYQQPRSVTIAGVTSMRTNERFYMVKNIPVKDVEKYLT